VSISFTAFLYIFVLYFYQQTVVYLRHFSVGGRRAGDRIILFHPVHGRPLRGLQRKKARAIALALVSCPDL